MKSPLHLALPVNNGIFPLPITLVPLQQQLHYHLQAAHMLEMLSSKAALLGDG